MTEVAPGANGRPTFDLQSHSRHSDGALRPSEVVTAAAAAGVHLLALSDHDSVDGVPDARAAQGKSIGRPHLAQAVVGHAANAERLADEGRHEASAFLEGYLIEGRPAFRRREGPTIPESVDTIHDAGGLAVWAHPFWDV